MFIAGEAEKERGDANADPENFSRGSPTLSKKNPITHTETPEY